MGRTITTIGLGVCVWSCGVSKSVEVILDKIELKELREALDRDQTLTQAQMKLYAAAARQRAGDRESRVHAIELYKEAASLWRGLNDSYEEALCLHNTGLVYSDLGEQQKALD